MAWHMKELIDVTWAELRRCTNHFRQEFQIKIGDIAKIKQNKTGGRNNDG